MSILQEQLRAATGHDFLQRTLSQVDPQIADAIRLETERQNDTLELIASENHVSQAVLTAMGSVFTNKYAEGYPGKRYYGGCGPTDIVENIAIERAKKLFGAEHANVQPHSGSQANMAVYFAVLKPGDTIMGMDLSHGGHLTHGHPLSYSGRDFKVIAYHVRQQDERIDYDEMERLAVEHKPRLIICGASAYSRVIDFKRIREICDRSGSLMMADIAHIAGLVVTGNHPSPVPYADFVTTTTHKTLRGPRAGLILCKEKYAKDLDRAVFPGVQGGPLVHIIAAKAVCVSGSADAGVQGVPDADRPQREGAGAGGRRDRFPHRLRRHRQSPLHDRRLLEGDHRKRRPEHAGGGEHHRQQEHHPLRHAEADGRIGTAHRNARGHDARPARARDEDDGAAHRSRPRLERRRRRHRSGEEGRQTALRPIPDLLIFGPLH